VACALALQGDAEGAWTELVRSIDAGVIQGGANHIATDPDLVSLHKHAGWAELLRRAAAGRQIHVGAPAPAKGRN